MTFMTASTLYWEQKGQFLANWKDAERAMAWLQTAIGGKTKIADISDADVARLVAKRRGQGVSNATVNRSVTEPLRAILRRSQRTWKQVVQFIEWKDHTLPESQERVREATEAEETVLSAKMRDDYAPALAFAMLTGCRRMEIVGLTWQTVDFFTRSFTVTGKRGRSRTIPMTNEVHDLLWALVKHHPTAVFTYVSRRPRERQVKGERQPITMEGFKTEWRRTKARAEIADFRFHDTRHTAATRLVRATGNIKLAQRLLGHTNLATTSRYSHVTNADLRAGLEAAARVTKTATQNTTEAAVSIDKPLKNKHNVE